MAEDTEGSTPLPKPAIGYNTKTVLSASDPDNLSP